MGIQGLLPVLKSIQKPCSLQKFSGLKLGVDVYGWLHRGTVACAVDLALGKPTSKFVEYAMNRVRMLIHFGVTPYLVFDGDYLPSKAATEHDRAKRREESKRIGIQLYNAGRVSQAHSELQKAVDVTPEMARQLIDELKRHNIEYIVAPYEADAQLAYLERLGMIQGIISEDSDLLVFGAKLLITKLDQYGKCVEINRNDFTACKELHLVGWTDKQFRQMAILSGCDYLSSINNMGLKTAYRLVRKYKNVEKIVQVLQFDSKFKVPEGYLDKFRRAELTFLHQRVFCPNVQEVIMATKISDTFQGNLDFIGKPIENDIGCAVALGDLHPTTKRPLSSSGPALRNSPSPWGMARRRSAQSISTPSKNMETSKPINSFFKTRRVPLAELDPNSFTPSPSQRRLQAQYNNNTWLSSPLVNTPIASASPRVQSSPRPLSTVCQFAVPESLSAPPVKRPRLCQDVIDEPGSEISSDIQTKSKFFKGRALEFSPLVVKKGRKKALDVHIYSDESVEEAMMSLPDIGDSSNGSCQKVAIFRDTSDDRIGSKPMNQGNVSQSSISVSTAESSAASAESSTDTQRPSQSVTGSHESCTTERNITDILKRFAHDSKAQPITAVSGHDPSDTDHGDIKVRIIPESPAKKGKTPLVGSEDCLVPNSEDETEHQSDRSEETPVKPKMNLVRFVYANTNHKER